MFHNLHILIKTGIIITATASGPCLHLCPIPVNQDLSLIKVNFPPLTTNDTVYLVPLTNVLSLSTGIVTE